MRFKFALLVVSSLLICGFDHTEIPYHPDPSITPGDLCTVGDPDLQEFRYAEKVPYCKRHVSKKTKVRVYELYMVPLQRRGEYTIDHFIPLSIGGGNHFENLWPEHKDLKRERIDLELHVYLDLKNGRINQATAIETIKKAKLNPPF